MVNIIWTIVVVLVILWLLGITVLHVAGGLIHILLVLVIIGIIYNLFVGRGPRV